MQTFQIGFALSAVFLALGCSDAAPPQPSSSAVIGADAGAINTTDSATPPMLVRESGTTEASSPPSPISAQVAGAYEGTPFVAKGGGVDRFYLQGRSAEGDDRVAGVSILVTQYESACTAVRDTTRPVLSLYLRSSHSELVPETFPIVDSFVAGGEGPPPQGTANIFGLDVSDCGVHNFDQATAGTVTLTSVTPTRVEATFNLTFKTSGAFTGTLALDGCKGVVPLDDSDPTLKCVL